MPRMRWAHSRWLLHLLATLLSAPTSLGMWAGADGIPDQYKGVQADLAREYVTLTRGKVATAMWLEHEPHGVPGGRGGDGGEGGGPQRTEAQ